MAWQKLKTEHAGAKNGGGSWGLRAFVKESADRRRRRADRAEINSQLCDDEALLPSPSQRWSSLGRRHRSTDIQR